MIAQGGVRARPQRASRAASPTTASARTGSGDNLDRYVDADLAEHVYLVARLGRRSASRSRSRSACSPTAGAGWSTPLTGVTSAIYTIPSPAMFLLLLPITGRGNATAIVALTAYTQVIIFRNVVNGLQTCPRTSSTRRAGMGMTAASACFASRCRSRCRRSSPALRIAAATTVGLAALAFLAGAGGLGGKLSTAAHHFKSNVVVAGGLVTLLAAVLDLLVLGLQRALTPWQRAVAA